MITINQDKDFHQEYKIGTIRGAIASRILDMAKHEYIEIKAVVRSSGEHLDAIDIRTHVKGISVKYDAKYKVTTRNQTLKILCLKAPERGDSARKKLHIKRLNIEAKNHVHFSYKNNSVRGSIALFLLDMKNGQSVNIEKVTDKHGDPVPMTSVRVHVSWIGRDSGAKFTTTMTARKKSLIVTMMQPPKNLRRLKEVKKTVTKRVYKERRPITVDQSMANKFILGGFGNVRAN